MNKAVCDRSGFTLPASKLRKTWDGLWVRPESFEPRHPQDFAGRARPESLPEVTRPPSDIFLTDTTTLAGYSIIETVTSTDMTISTAPTSPTMGTFLNPGDVTSDDL